MSAELLEGSEAIARAMVSAGCRFFAGYPMTPFTEVLEGMAKLLPAAGGDCVNAESELEAIGMAWGAAAAGARAATGSVGQGLSLMQESIAELCFARVPMVVLNMARGQGDYYQATRGGGHGDYRTIVLAPVDLAEAVRLVQLAFYLADKFRNPVMFMGDYYLAHVFEAVDTGTVDFGTLPRKEWALDGSSSGTGNARIVSSIMPTKRNAPVYVEYGAYLETASEKIAAIERQMEPLYEQAGCEDADCVIVAYGTPARIVRYVAGQLRREGLRVGFFRPVTLWPFPSAQLAAATRSARGIGVYELNAGQMIDDVRLAVRDRNASSIGGPSFDSSGFGIAPELTPSKVAARIRSFMAETCRVPGSPHVPGSPRVKCVIPTDVPPSEPATLVDDFAPPLILPGAHKLCAGCGEPAAMRAVVEMIAEMGFTHRAVAVFGIGCYTSFSPGLDVEVMQALHGRAPSLATGLKRVHPDSIVFTMQGDGDMVNEGLQEVIHTAARGENVTCIMLNNGVFGETGGHMTATTVLGQRTKNSLEGREAKKHGFPIRMAEMLAPLDGVAYVARGATNNARNIFRTRKMLRSALAAQDEKRGFSFVEILTMCPTGWFIETGDAPAYLGDKMASFHKMGVIKNATVAS